VTFNLEEGCSLKILKKGGSRLDKKGMAVFCMKKLNDTSDRPVLYASN